MDPVIDPINYFEAAGYHEDDIICIGWKTSDGFGFKHTPAGNAYTIIGQHQNTDCYISAGVYKAVPAKGRGTGKDISHFTALWADLDYDKGFETADRIREAVARISTAIGSKPSVMLASGGGYQPRWLIEDDVPWSDIGRFGQLVKGVAAEFGATADSVFEPARMLRAPGSYNHKTKDDGGYLYGSEPSAVEIRVAKKIRKVPSSQLIKALDEAGIDALPSSSTEDREEHRELSPGRGNSYAESAVQHVQKMLRDTHAWEDGHRDERGRGWEKICADAAYRLGELVKAGWNELSESEAKSAFLVAAPRGGSVNDQWLDVKWREQFRLAKSAPPPKDVPMGASRIVKAATADDLYERRRLEFTHADQAMVVVEETLRGKWVWSKSLGWMKWTGVVWERRAYESVRGVVSGFFRTKLAQEEDSMIAKAGGRASLSDSDKAYIKAMNRMLNKSSLDAVTALAGDELQINKPEDIFDSRPDYLNCPNGVVDLKTAELLPHDPSYYMTKVTGCSYDPSATDADELRMVLDNLPDKETQEWLQVRMGQAATGYVAQDDILTILEGGGSNGKSTLIDVIMAALGDYAKILSHNILLGEEGHPTEKMSMRGIRVGFFEELPNGRELNMNRVKKVVGTSKIDGHYMRMDHIEFDATHSLFITTNNQPIVKESDHGSWRRLARVLFPLRYVDPGEPLVADTDRHKDSTIKKRLQDGDPGFQTALLAWIVQGALKWYESGCVLPPLPPKVREDTLDWRKESDLILSFIEESVEFDKSSRIVSHDLYEQFTHWMQEARMHAWASNSFTRSFMAHAYVSGKVKKMRARDLDGVSRTEYLVNNVPEASGQQAVIEGIRFKKEAKTVEAAVRPVSVIHSSKITSAKKENAK